MRRRNPVGFKMHARFTTPAALLVCLLLLLSACRAFWTPDDPLAVPAAEFNQLFEHRGGGWTGGDGTVSVLLPDGRNVWLFGDTLLGTVRADDTRPEDTPFVHNSLVVQNDRTMETRLGAHAPNNPPAAAFEPPKAGQWYWPGDGTVEGDRLRIFLHRFEQTAPRLWAWRWIGTDIASLALPSLAPTGFATAPSDNGIIYGVCLLESEHFTYIFGIDDARHPKQAHLARAQAGHIQGPWTYFANGRWSETPGASQPILAGVSTQYAVIRVAPDFYLFSMDARVPFSSEIVVYRAQRPQGPWQGPLTVYKVPETTSEIIAYNPFVHSQFTNDGLVLVSYNLNHATDPTALYRDAAIYRPRFIRVDLSAVARRFDAEQ
jgi:hypothetical protein